LSSPKPLAILFRQPITVDSFRFLNTHIFDDEIAQNTNRQIAGAYNNLLPFLMFLNGLGVKIFEKLNCTGCHENKYVVYTILIHITEQIDIAQVIAPHIIDTRIHTIRHKIIQGTMIQ